MTTGLAMSAPLPCRIQPGEGELLHGYIGRLAKATNTTPSTVARSLGLPYPLPAWIGCDLRTLPAEAVDLFRTRANLNDAGIQRLHPDASRIAALSEYYRSIPQYSRACAVCLHEGAPWQRRWTDPWQAACAVHGAVLADTAPGSSERPMRTSDVPRLADAALWGRLPVEPDAGLAELQTRLNDARRAQDPDDDTYSIEDRILQVLAALRALEKRHPASELPGYVCLDDVPHTLERLQPAGATWERPDQLRMGPSVYGTSRNTPWIEATTLALLLPWIVVWIVDSSPDETEAIIDELACRSGEPITLVRANALQYRGLAITQPKRTANA